MLTPKSVSNPSSNRVYNAFGTNSKINNNIIRQYTAEAKWIAEFKRCLMIH